MTEIILIVFDVIVHDQNLLIIFCLQGVCRLLTVAPHKIITNLWLAYTVFDALIHYGIASKLAHVLFFWRMRKIACVFTHAIWTVLLNNVCCIYFCRRMRKSHAIIRSEKIATHPIWMYPNSSIRVAGCDIRLSDSVRNLGVIIDSRLSFDEHVSRLCRSCYFHMKAFRQIRHSLTIDRSKTIARSIVMSRLDYCKTSKRCAGLEIRDPRKISIFCITLYCMNYFSISAEITCYQLVTYAIEGY